ncbi:MAG: NAD(P)/FAD-dependent oxidoreductase [Actinobacteria bacterium]|nr:NAD(P)/FAD-dependent oxidoreductase [Actinomycetota bacterium]
MPDRGQVFDAVVVGGGHNGLICAIGLARAGWTTLVVEAEDVLGGAVRSSELTEPGVIHDWFATNQDGFHGGPVDRALDLERHGLRWAHSRAPYANVYPDGSSLTVFQDVERTLTELGRHDPRDADGWRELHAIHGRLAPVLSQISASEPLSPSGVWRALRAGLHLGPGGRSELAELLSMTTRELGERYLASEESRALITSWGMHLDYGPDVPGGALFPFVECFADMEHGMSIVEGGCARLIDALVAEHAALGGRTRTEARVERVIVEGGRARGVVLADGEEIRAGRAVVAGVTPTALYGSLLDESDAPAADRAAGRRFIYGPATMMIHLLLDGPVPWAAGPDLAAVAFIHIAPYTAQLADTYTASVNGVLAADPMLVVGQPTAVDPTRAPAGRHVACVHVRTLPATVTADAAGEIVPADWDAIAPAVADRALAKLAEYAPGIGDRILDRVIFSPADLERHDANLVGGDSGAGSHHPFQYQLQRPFAGRSPYETRVAGLYMTGASTWPGAGVTGLPGHLSAKRILRPRPWRRLGAYAALGAAATAGGLAFGQARKGE